MITSDIGPLLQRIREKKGISRKQIANMTGYHRNSIFRFESGKPMRVEQLERIAGALGVSVLKIMKHIEKQAQPQVQTEETSRKA